MGKKKRLELVEPYMFFYCGAELSAEERYWFLHDRRWFLPTDL